MKSLRIGLTGPDLPAILVSLPGRMVPAGPPAELSVDDQPAEVRERWLDDLLHCELSAMARWPGAEDGSFLSLDRGELVRLNTVREPDPVDMLRTLIGTPFRLASFAPVHREWVRRAEPYRSRSFGGLHYPHGWACAFRLDAHQTLVSRRWLEHGPWRLLYGPGDLTLVQFHDLAADPETALAQAFPGHQALDLLNPASGYLWDGHQLSHDLDGLYNPDERCLRIIVHGREVSLGEMRDACFARSRGLLGPDRPIERVAYVFMEPEPAKAHLHELWLRELECWTIELGREIRLDADYHPAPVRPAWVEAL